MAPSIYQPRHNGVVKVLDATRSESLVGRDVEQHCLLDVFNRTHKNKSAHGTSEIVVVSGKSGVGKSAIVDSLRQAVADETPEQDARGIFASGKFDQNRNAKPYAALVDAVEMLLRNLHRSLKWEEVKTRIKDMKGDAKALSSIFPGLSYVLDSSEQPRRRPNKEGPRKIPLERLSELLKKFLRTVANTVDETLILFLDDLHWACPSTLDLLKFVLCDTEAKGILHIWTYRSEEVSGGDHLWSILRSIEDVKRFTSLSVNELDVSGVNGILAKSTDAQPEQTMKLAELIHKKTNGNCFFVWNFLQMLQDENLMTFSLENYSWQWDLEAIARSTMTTENVADILVDRINRLSDSCREMLKIAACFGSDFDKELVFVVLYKKGKENEGDTPLDLTDDSSIVDLEASVQQLERFRSSFDQDMEKLMACGLIGQANAGLMKFSHDRVWQAVIEADLAGSGVEAMHLKIGKLLFGLRNSPEHNREWIFFGAVDQLNRGSARLGVSNKVTLAKLNLRAAELAKNRSAFVPACGFLRSGIGLLEGTDKWGEHYDLCLELYSSAAEIEHCATNFEQCNKFVDEVNANARSVHDNFRAHLTRAQALSSQGKHQDSVECGLGILKLLGEEFPQKVNILHILGAITKAKRLLRGKSEEDLTSIPPMTDETKLCATKMMQHVANAMFFVKERSLLPLLYVRLLELSLVHGKNGYTAAAFASYAMMICKTSMDMDQAYKLGSLAWNMRDQADPNTVPTLNVIYYYFITHWKTPLRESLDPLLRGFEIGMEVGEMHHGLLCAGGYCGTYLQCGLPLKPIAEDLKNFLRLMQDYKQRGTYMIYTTYRQYILNLMGEAENPLVLTGDVMDEETFLKGATTANDEVAMWNFNHRYLSLAVWFGDMERALEYFDKTRKGALDVKSSFKHSEVSFLGGLIYFHMAKTTRKRAMMYKRKARSEMKYLEKWVKGGNLNCVDMLQLLQAEQLAGSKGAKEEDVRRAYDTAIQSSVRSGFLHLAALGNERAGRYFLSRGGGGEQDEQGWGSLYMTRAIDLYREWGAWGKVHAMEWQHEFLSSKPRSPSNEAKTLSTFQGRMRFSQRTVNQRERLSYDS